MVRLVALAMLGLALAGCTAPEPAPPADPGSGLGGFYDPPPDAPAPLLVDSSGQPDATAAQPTGSEHDAPGSAAGHTTGAEPAPPPGAAGPTPPTAPFGEAPRWKLGDQWVYRGVNHSGARNEEVRTVAARGTQGGVPVYVLNVAVNGAHRDLNVTQAGVNDINRTGFVTELLRFPLAVGNNWTFSWREDGSVHEANGSPLSWGWVQWLRGDVHVLGAERVRSLAGGFDAFHLRTTLTSGVGKYDSKEVVMDYWYADAAKGIVRFEATQDGASVGWSELSELRLG